MKKYIFMRVLRSLVSIFLVTTLTYTIIYTLVPRKLIFKQDPNYNKIATTADKRDNYENTVFERMGYIEYYDTKELQEKASSMDSSVTVEANATNKAIYEKYINQLGHGWTLGEFTESGQFYATREIPIFERVFHFYANLIDIDHTNKIQDPENPDLKRYLRFENDPAIGWSLVGSGTKHKYLLYFNSQFPTGKKTSSVNIYSRTYKSPSQADSREVASYGKDDPYTATESNYQYPSMIVSSAITGLIGLVLAYALAVPLGSAMARFKNTWIDSLSTGALTFLLALPTIALVYIVRLIGSSISLPDSFPILGAGDWRSYVLPAVILGLLGAPGTAIWIRRYMIDLQSQDFVRFARAKGLSEKEISNKHIFKNAMVPLVSGIPGAIIGVIGGATLTETVFAFPGMGKMLIDSVKASNNSMVVGLVFIFTCISIFSRLLGDIWMTIIDPRIKLTEKGGK